MKKVKFMACGLILFMLSCNKKETALQTKPNLVSQKHVTSLVSGDTFMIENCSTYGAVSVVGNSLSNGALIDQWTYKQTTGQKYVITQVGAYYKIINVNSGLAVEVPTGGVAGTQLDQKTYTGVDNQLWTNTDGGFGTSYFTNKASGYAITLDVLSGTDGVKITQQPYTASLNQKWFAFDLNQWFFNPLLSSGADTWVTQYSGYYYYTNTTGSNITIWKTAKMSDLHTAAPVIVWTPPTGTAYSKDIWAPELHYLDSKWYLYFAADDGTNANHRIYVLENANADPTTGTWTFKGQIYDSTNRFAIDATVFDYGGFRYMVWCGWDTTTSPGKLFIAKMSSDWTITGPRTMISQPQYAWEENGNITNEGPEALQNSSGSLFLTYSASSCGNDAYCLGLLSLKTGGNPLVQTDWVKSSTPIFSTSTANSVYAPGHNGFFRSLSGTEDWIIYGANSISHPGGDGCGASRSPRMQKFTWNTDGTPNFGTPAVTTLGLLKPSGE